MNRSFPKESARSPLEITSLSAIEHVLQHRPSRIRNLRVGNAGKPGSHGRVAELVDKARGKKIPVEFSNAAEPVTAALTPFAYTDFKDFLSVKSQEKTGILLALDHLQDPQNFGALCRTADAFDIQGILLPKDRSVTVGPGVYHASVGAVETVPVIAVSNIGDALRKCKEAGYWIIGTSLGAGAKTFDQTPNFEKVVLVLGTEHEGMSPSVAKICDWTLEIPLLGRVQSLNVSVAGGLFLYEWSKRLRLSSQSSKAPV